MKYIISENKMYNTFSSFLNSLGLSDVMSHGNGIDSCYYPVEWHEYDYDEDEYEPAPCLFRYFKSEYDYSEWHGVSDTYSNQDYPIIELDWEMYKQIEDLFGERTITKFGPKFFQDIVHQEVKTIVSE
jgi:hypothetical protein